MKQRTRTTLAMLSLFVASASIAACDKEDKASTAEEPSATAPAGEAAAKTVPASAASEAAAPADPGKLKTIMVQLREDMNQLHSGLWIEDFDLIATSAMAIAEHPKVNDQEKMRVKATMGEDMGAFVAMDKAVHGTALAIAEAARKKEMPVVLKELGTLQNSCVTCHSIFRGRLTK